MNLSIIFIPTVFKQQFCVLGVSSRSMYLFREAIDPCQSALKRRKTRPVAGIYRTCAGRRPALGAGSAGGGDKSRVQIQILRSVGGGRRAGAWWGRILAPTNARRAGRVARDALAGRRDLSHQRGRSGSHRRSQVSGRLSATGRHGAERSGRVGLGAALDWLAPTAPTARRHVRASVGGDLAGGRLTPDKEWVSTPRAVASLLVVAGADPVRLIPALTTRFAASRKHGATRASEACRSIAGIMKTPTQYGSENEETSFIRRVAAPDRRVGNRRQKKRVAIAAATVGLVAASGVVGYASMQRSSDNATNVSEAEQLEAQNESALSVPSFVSELDDPYYPQFSELDANKNGVVSQTEFLVYLNQRQDTQSNLVTSSDLPAEIQDYLLSQLDDKYSQESQCAMSAIKSVSCRAIVLCPCSRS
jgi:hypothetical protein